VGAATGAGAVGAWGEIRSVTTGATRTGAGGIGGSTGFGASAGAIGISRLLLGQAPDFHVEPLPAGHAFWGMSNVLLSPHTADRVENFFDLAYEAFFENLDHFCKGERLEYLVDKHAGY
jgi:hypothetical protein